MGSYSGKIRRVTVDRTNGTGFRSSDQALHVQGKRLSPKVKVALPLLPAPANDKDSIRSWKKSPKKIVAKDAEKEKEKEKGKMVIETNSVGKKPAEGPTGEHHNSPKKKKKHSPTKNGKPVGSNNKQTRTSCGRQASKSSVITVNGHGKGLNKNNRCSPSPKTKNPFDLSTLPPAESFEAISAAIARMRRIVEALSKTSTKEDLVKNLEYVVSVLKAFKNRSSRQILEEDEEEDVLSEAESKGYPSEVRDWLTMTFTRSLTNIKRRQDKLHFRGVANAIRAGIVVDRIYRRMSSTVGLHVPPNVLLMMKNLDDWSFDVFQVNEVGEGHALKYIGYELLQKHDLINKFKINTQSLDNFLVKLEQGYSKHGNPYHNLTHAADVTQTTHHLFSCSGLQHWLTDLEIFAVLTSAMIHDYEHTGTTNAFHINTRSNMALLYNDRAVLENHHASAAFRLLKEENYNIVASLSKEEFKEFRVLVIDIVLATDMSFHFQQLKNMKNLLSMPENIDKSKALSMVVHCADISHPAKDWHLHQRWTDLLVEEFFRQGDKEALLELPISPLCDRKNTVVAESQIGFIDFIVDPSFQVMGDMLDKIIAPLRQQRGSQETLIVTKTSRGSVSSLSSRSSNESLHSTHNSIHSNEVPNFEVKRYWVDCLHDNKRCWQERAVKDADALGKKLNEEIERLESPNLGILSSSSITQSVISDRKSDHPKTNNNVSKQDDLDPGDGADDRDDQDLVSIANSEDNSLVVSEPGEDNDESNNPNVETPPLTMDTVIDSEISNADSKPD